jgi:plasmid stability protein
VASITVRNLDGALKKQLRIRAAEHDRSMEDEVREILRIALSTQNQPPRNLADAIRERFDPLGGVDLPPVPREPSREPPTFGE